MSHVPTTTSRLLALPLELRLQIYDYVLALGPPVATFSTAKLVGRQADVIHRLYGEGRAPFSEHLPEHHIPIIEPEYDARLLSTFEPAEVCARDRIKREEQGQCGYSPIPPIALVNKQIYAEILRHMSPEQREGFRKFSLFMSYPYGMHVFHGIGSHLLPCAQTVQIAGIHTNESFSNKRAAKAAGHLDTCVPETRAPPFSEELSNIVAGALGPIPKITQLQMRIYYPGSDSYSAVWGDDNSPTVVALRNVYAGDIEIEIWRGSDGTGVNLMARPSLNKKRTVSTVWRRIENNTGSMKAKADAWLLDTSWPEISLLQPAEERSDPRNTILTREPDGTISGHLGSGSDGENWPVGSLS